MRAFQIFKPGKHTAASGVTLEFSEDMLKAAIAAYDPALSKAPIVVGHPKDNHPAYGWVKSLDFDEDGAITANPEDVDPEFSELVKNKRYKNRSASWYLPDSPNNPKPGTLYLRHVGFLGAQAPAIKGLKDVNFSEEEGVVEFVEVASSSWAWSSLARLLGGLRDAMIADKGLDQADKVLPKYMIEDLQAEATRKLNPPVDTSTATVVPNFTEQNTMTPEQIAEMQAENARLKATQQPADFAEKQADLAKREAAMVRKEIGTEVDKLIAEGKVLPAQKAGLVEFLASLDEADVVEFSEADPADKTKIVTHKKSQREFMRGYLAGLPKLVDFKEHSASTTTGNDEFDVKAAERKISDQVANGGNTK